MDGSVGGDMATSVGTLTLDTINDLREAYTAEGQLVLVLGVATYGDGLGGFYRWVGSSNAVEDTAFYNVIASNVTTPGRWIRVFQRVRQIGGNTLVSNGSFKMLFAPGVADSNGRVTVYLTDDGTATGNALFTTIMQTTGEGTAAVSDPNNVLIGARYSMSSDLKTLVYQFARGNSTVLSVLGTNVIGMRSAATGAPVSVRIEGV